MTLLWLFGFSKVKWLQLTGEVGKSITCWCQFSRTKSIKISQFLTESIKKLKVSLFETQCRWSVYCHIFRATISAQKALFIYCVWLLIEWLLIDLFSRFCTAHGRKSLYFTIVDPFPQNCAFLWGIWTPYNSWLLGSVRAHSPNGITIGSAVFAQVTPECPWLYIGCSFPPKLSFPMRDLNPI